MKTVTVEVKVDAKTDPALVIDKKSLTIPSSAKNVFANIKLKRKTGPVELHVDFKTATGGNLSPYTRTVPQSFQGPIRIPEGAVSAHFTIKRPTPEAKPQVLSFVPSAK